MPNYRPERIRRLREKLDKPQYVVAMDANMAQGHLSNLERGHVTSIGSEHLSNLARVLGTNIGYLVGTTNDPRPSAYMRDDELTPDEEQLIRTFRQIKNPVLRDLALELVKGTARADNSR